MKNDQSLFEYLSQILANELGRGFDSTDMKHVEGLKSICDKIIRAYMDI